MNQFTRRFEHNIQCCVRLFDGFRLCFATTTTNGLSTHNEVKVQKGTHSTRQHLYTQPFRLTLTMIHLLTACQMLPFVVGHHKGRYFIKKDSFYILIILIKSLL